MELKSVSKQIKQKAHDLGFVAVGICKADFLASEAEKLQQWLQEGSHAQMHYMENHFEKRTDPRKLVDNAQSVISVLYNYFPKQKQRKDTYQISKYAYGKDYHYVVKEKLFRLLEFIQEKVENTNGRAFVDSAPVMDKAWAVRSGIGWMGKNTNILTKEHGSFVFIGELIIDAELDYEKGNYSNKNYCGNCTKCIDACPTGALSPYHMDAQKCISYLTIEKKDEIPESFTGQWSDWIFGCDSCQDVCPWNQKLTPHSEDQFLISDFLQDTSPKQWEELTKANFKKIFKHTPLERTKFEGLQRNIAFLKKNK